MDISLSEDITKALDELVASGQYHSRSDAIHEAILLLLDRDTNEPVNHGELRAAIQRGLEDARNGRVHDGGPKFIQGVLAEARDRAKSSRPQSKSA